MKQKDEMRRWRLRMPLGIALVSVLGALVLAGCGSSGGSGSSESTTASTGSAEGSTSGSEGGAGAPAKFEISEEARSCLKEKGVELPEMGAGGEPPQGGEKGEMPNPPEGGQGEPPAEGMGPGGEKMQKAFEECGVETPEFKGGPGGEGGPNVNSAAFKKQVREYVACVKENGYELGEPNFSGEGPIFERSESESAAFKAASAKCEGLLGGPGRGGGSSGESSSGEGESS